MGSELSVSEIPSQGSIQIKAEAWSDNWFAFYLGDELVVEDSVSITTERSFNAESFIFNADFPLQLNFVLKDFKENDSGLEYIGARNQQMGDGSFIVQFVDVVSDELVAYSNDSWKCLVIHDAPLDKSCENSDNPIAGEGACNFISIDEPVGWKSTNFDDSNWPNAIQHSAAAIDPKGGYDQIDWQSEPELIWSADLETHNTLLCRATISQ
ncbi:MAG: PEBP family protein [Pseudomonadales bacterium]|nr:PEBP family protein [Pseudomonadales bacterium]